MMPIRFAQRAATAATAGFCGTCVILQSGSGSVSAQAVAHGSASSGLLVESSKTFSSRVCAFSTVASVPAMKEPFTTEVSKLPTQAQAVLRFWYPDMESGDCKMQQFWFAGGDKTDDEIRSKFGDTLEEALAGGTCGTAQSNFLTLQSDTHKHQMQGSLTGKPPM